MDVYISNNKLILDISLVQIVLFLFFKCVFFCFLSYKYILDIVSCITITCVSDSVCIIKVISLLFSIS